MILFNNKKSTVCCPISFSTVYIISKPVLAYKFRLYPDHTQYEKLQDTLGACRWTYNHMIEKIHNEGFQSRNDLNYFLTELKEQNTWLYQHHSKMLQMVSTQIFGAQQSLVNLAKKGHKTGKLKFALYNRYNTFVYNQSGFDIKDGCLYLSKIGKIRLVQHREINGEIKQIIISKQANKWFACVIFDCMVSKPKLVNAVGIDVGIKNFAYDSDGHVTPNPQNLQKMLKPLARIQRKMSRKQKGSQNRKKVIKWYQKIHQKITNMRRDFCHKLSAAYAKKYNVVYLENLQIQNMVHNKRLSRKILDSGWSIFRTFLQYKTNVILVPAQYTSIICSRCHNKVPKKLAVRIHVCDVCGLVLDRDHNAAINILNSGLPQELRELTPVEISKRSVKLEKAPNIFGRGSPKLDIHSI